MEGSLMLRLANALDDVGFVIKKMEEETYSRFERPDSDETYTGEIIIKIRPRKDEDAEAGKRRDRLREKQKRDQGIPMPVPARTDSEVEF
jgi:hypothetical protein